MKNKCNQKPSATAFATGLNGKVAVITGAGGAICGAIARALSAHGASVAIWDLSKAAGNLDFMIQSGKAKIVRPGRDLTAIAYGFMTHQALETARRLMTEGIDVEVIDLRTVDDAGMDYTLIGQSIVKTGALLSVKEAPHYNSIGAKIAIECIRRYYDYFDGPPMAVTAPDIPMPVSRRLEQACIPTLDQICEAMIKTAKRQT